MNSGLTTKSKVVGCGLMHPKQWIFSKKSPNRGKMVQLHIICPNNGQIAVSKGKLKLFNAKTASYKTVIKYC